MLGKNVTMTDAWLGELAPTHQDDPDKGAHSLAYPLLLLRKSKKKSGRAFLCGRLGGELAELHAHCEGTEIDLKINVRFHDRRLEWILKTSKTNVVTWPSMSLCTPKHCDRAC